MTDRGDVRRCRCACGGIIEVRDARASDVVRDHVASSLHRAWRRSGGPERTTLPPLRTGSGLYGDTWPARVQPAPDPVRAPEQRDELLAFARAILARQA